MIKPKCDKCGQELTAYGALIFSPPQTLPDNSSGRTVDKLHICVNCWSLLLEWLKQPLSTEVKLPDGWWIPHPGSLVWTYCDSFEQAMENWFEGFNIPRLVENGRMEDIATASKRVRHFYGEKAITLNQQSTQ